MGLDFSYIKRFRGFLGWEAFKNGLGVDIPAMEVELYINNYNIPIRKRTYTEMVTIPQFDPISQKEIGTAAIFEGPPDILQMELTGWTITFQNSSRQWLLYAKDGKTAVGDGIKAGDPQVNIFGNIPYSEVVSTYISGMVNLTKGGARQRKDPDYYISPQGYVYNNPYIAQYQSAYTPGPVKQTFEMTLFLES